MIRKPVAAGRFYPSAEKTLREQVATYLRKVSPIKDKIFGVLAPHAGYPYSGSTAGESLSHLANIDFNTVFVLAAAHTVYVDGAALIKKGFYQTPLGKCQIDEDATGELLRRSSLFEDVPHAHEDEHSIEVLLPFIQCIKENFKIVPLVLNTSNVDTLVEIGKNVAACMKTRKAVICVSSDLSHYPPANVAEKADMAVLESLKIAMRNGDIPYFHLANELIKEKAKYNMHTTACGQAAISAAASACLELGANHFEILKYTHSGKVSKDDSNVVGYGAGLFVKSSGELRAFELTEGMKKELLYYARRSIEYYLKNKKAITFELSENYRFNVPAAVFVTLKVNGNLRGCIGTMHPKHTLLDAVVNFAVAAAFEDPRFPSLCEKELKKTKIEISILSPMRRVNSYKEVVERKHGVYVKKGFASGTYLPQVWEHFRTREDFLRSLCAEKAGISPDAWKEKSTDIHVYTVDSFQE